MNEAEIKKAFDQLTEEQKALFSALDLVLYYCIRAEVMDRSGVYGDKLVDDERGRYKIKLVELVERLTTNKNVL